jgi:diacylglycerol kinase family enzyme
MSIERPLDSAVLVINPTRYPGYVRLLKRLAKQRRIPEIVETRDREHFAQSVREFCRGPYRYLLVWGGDGTAHLAINAMMSADCDPGKAVGFLRGGSGNGIQDSYSVPYGLWRQVRTFAHSISRDLTVSVDLLRVEDGGSPRYGQLLGLGFDAQVLARRERADRRRRRGTGLAGYMRAGLHVFFGPFFDERRPFHLSLSDGKYAYRGPRINAEYSFEHLSRTTRAPLIELGTRPFYGKLFKVCPDVVCNDGNLDLYVFDIRGKQAIAMNMSVLWRGKHDVLNRRLIVRRQGMIERYEVKRVEIESPSAFDYHVDGELLRARSVSAGGDSADGTADAGEAVPGVGARVSVSVVPGALRFLVPERFYRLFHPFDFDAGFE